MYTDPRNIPERELERMRGEVLRSYQIEPWTRYSEKQTAWLMTDPKLRKDEADTSTLKRNRKAGRVPHSPTGNGSIRYWGTQIADYLLFGEAAWFLWGKLPSKEWREKHGFVDDGRLPVAAE